jgi:hypothetical protein
LIGHLKVTFLSFEIALFKLFIAGL